MSFRKQVWGVSCLPCYLGTQCGLPGMVPLFPWWEVWGAVIWSLHWRTGYAWSDKTFAGAVCLRVFVASPSVPWGGPHLIKTYNKLVTSCSFGSLRMKSVVCWTNVMFCKIFRWPRSLQSVLTESWRVDTALGRDRGCVHLWLHVTINHFWFSITTGMGKLIFVIGICIPCTWFGFMWSS